MPGNLVVKSVRSTVPPRVARASIALLASVALLSLSAAAQQLALISYTAEAGPSHPQVWSMYQDSRGYLWIGTSEGLSRWDAVEFVGFSAADGLHDLTVRNILEDDGGDLWLGTNDGVARFDGRTFRVFAGDGGPGEGTVWSAAKDPRGRMWFGTNSGGVGVWTGSGFSSFSTADGLAADYVYGLLADRQGQLWLGHRGAGLTRCRIAEPLGLADCRAFGTPEGLAHDEVRAFAEDARGHVWIGTRGGGISRWDGQRFETFTSEDGLASDDIYALLVDARDQLVIGTVRHGITICDLPELTHCRSYGIGNGLADDAVLSLALDRDQTLWVGLSNGLSQLWTEDVESYTLRDGLPHRTVYSVTVDPDGTVWAGTLDGLARIRRPAEGGEGTRVDGWASEGTLPGYEVWGLRRDSQGRLWAATERGLCRFQEGQCREVLTAADGLADTDLITLLLTRDGSFWVGTVNGASRLRFPPAGGSPEVTNLRVEDGLAGPFVNALSEDADGILWLGTDQGLSRWDGDRLLSFTLADGLPVAEILSVLTGRDGRLWLGTNGGGLVGVGMEGEQARFVVHGRERGIPEVVGALLDAGGGLLWLGTGDGALLYDPDAEIAEDAVAERIDLNAGLAGSEVNAFAASPSGALWIATSGGLTRVNTGREKVIPDPPPVTLEWVRTVAGQEWRTPFTAPSALRDPEVAWFGEAPMDLSHDFAALRFEFRALSFGPRPVHFQVWLEGFERDWSPPFTSTFKEYTNLDPGGYILRVRAASESSDWSEPASLRFAVVPAWWQTGWFQVGAVLGVIVLVAMGVWTRTSQIRRRARELERAVAERTDDLQRYARALEEHSQAIARANVRILEADRVKSEFLANMSHELRTPLNSIIGFSEILVPRLEGRAEERELRFLRNVSRSGRYLLLLINNLLDLSKIEADRMEVDSESVELPHLLEETLGVVQGYASDQSVIIDLWVTSAPPEVEVDVAKLNQILINLLSNAVKFSDPGGHVDVDVRAVTAADSALGVASYELAVTDRGPGIREEDRSVIFEAFRQAGGSEHPGGTGLGLALVRRYVTLLGGRVDFESVVGEGTTFRVLLPVHAVPCGADGGEGEAPALPDELLGRPCVLVVEQDPSRFAELARALEDRGLLPVRAGDADEAVRMANGLRPAALVVSREAVGDRDWAALATLYASPDALPVVHTARCGSPGPALIAADACLLHPVETENLLAAVRSLGIGQGGRVLLAGGEPATRAAVQEVLDGRGYEVHLQPDTEVPPALEIDLVLLDLAGPEPESAVAACGVLAGEKPRILLLPATHTPRLPVVEESAASSFDELAQSVRDLLARRAQR